MLVYCKRNICIYSYTVSLTAPDLSFLFPVEGGRKGEAELNPAIQIQNARTFFFFALNLRYLYLHNASITYFWPNQYRLLHLIQYKCDKGKNNLQIVVWIKYLLVNRSVIPIICKRLWLLRQIPQRTSISLSVPATIYWQSLFRNIVKVLKRVTEVQLFQTYSV